MTLLNLAIDRGNGSVKYFAHLTDGRTYRGKFASLLLPNPTKKINPVTVGNQEWLYGANAGKVGLSIAVSPNQNGTQGKIDHFAVVLAAVLQELSAQVELGDDVVIETLSIVSPIASDTLKAKYEEEIKGKKFSINGAPLKVKVKKIEIYPESAVILQKVQQSVILDVGYGTCLGSVRGWGEVIPLTLEHGAEQMMTAIVTHPKFIAGLATDSGKAIPSMELVALFLANGHTQIRGVDLLPLLREIVPQWYEAMPLAMLPKLQRFARENDREETALLIGGGAQLLKLALGAEVQGWVQERGCVLPDEADFLTVQTLGELWETESAKKQVA